MALTSSSGYPYYIDLAGTGDVLTLLKDTHSFDYLATISEEKSTHRYAPNKWSIKQVVGHIADHERIMTYRALRFSRKDTTPQPGYDQDVLVGNGRFDDISYKDLLQDLHTVRNSTISFVTSLSKEQLPLIGTASNFELSVLEVLKATIGHELHHVTILKDRYLVNND